MPEIKPFRAVLYNPKKVKISKVVSPPYDIILPKMQDELYEKSEYNFVRLDLGKQYASDSPADNRYTRAKVMFNEWLNTSILAQEREPAFYVYSQEYVSNKKKKTAIGFIALMKLEDAGSSRVLPHENTFSKPKEDRLSLTREVKANLSCIFTLFRDKAKNVEKILKTVAKKKSYATVKFDNTTHKIWKLTDAGLINRIQRALSGKDIFIADGHHRYEVARMYRDEMRSKPATSRPDGQAGDQRPATHAYDYVMTYFTPILQGGLIILATHRVVRKLGMDLNDFLGKLKSYFDLTALRSQAQLVKRISLAKTGEHLLGLYADKGFYLLRLKKGVDINKEIREDRTAEWKKLDVSVLHGLIFDNILKLKEQNAMDEGIIYTRDPKTAIEAVKSGRCEAAFFLNPTKPSEVETIAKIGDKMPHKSTYFYPKLLSGLVINKV